jgi:hypothetical protein
VFAVEYIADGDNRTENANKRRAQFADELVHGVEGPGWAGLRGRLLAAGANTGESEE